MSIIQSYCYFAFRLPGVYHNDFRKSSASLPEVIVITPENHCNDFRAI